MGRKLDNKAVEWGWALLAALGIFLLALLSPISYSSSDPAFTLVTSQSIIEEGTIQLNAYAARAGSTVAGDPRIATINGDLYSFFPMGTPLLATPFVWLARRMGADMLVAADNAHWQNILSALIVAAIFLTLFRVARAFLPVAHSLLLAGAGVMGSALISTLGTALWDQAAETLLLSIALLLLVRKDRGSDHVWDPFLLGLLLFTAFLVRPTAVAFVIPALILLALWAPQYSWRAGIVAGSLFFAFVLFSWMEFGQWLPPYYLPGRLGTGDTPLHLTLYGLFLSPSRGLLIFSPILLLLIGGLLVGLFQRWVRLNRLWWFLLAWFAGHFLITAGFGHWWGGHSYGPRLMTEMMPGLILAAALLWNNWRAAHRPAQGDRLLALVALVLAAGSIALNSGAGLFNPWTQAWNGDLAAPDVDYAPQTLFDWRYPQFLAGRRSLCERNIAFVTHQIDEGRLQLAPYHLGTQIGFAAATDSMRLAPGPQWFEALTGGTDNATTSLAKPNPHAIYLPVTASSWPLLSAFPGWSYPQSSALSPICERPFIVLGPVSAGDREHIRLRIDLLGNSPGPVNISVNGVPIGIVFTNEAAEKEGPSIDTSLLLDDEPNWFSLAPMTDSEIEEPFAFYSLVLN